jgi:hypothetical protein
MMVAIVLDGVVVVVTVAVDEDPGIKKVGPVKNHVGILRITNGSGRRQLGRYP